MWDSTNIQPYYNIKNKNMAYILSKFNLMTERNTLDEEKNALCLPTFVENKQYQWLNKTNAKQTLTTRITYHLPEET